MGLGQRLRSKKKLLIRLIFGTRKKILLLKMFAFLMFRLSFLFLKSNFQGTPINNARNRMWKSHFCIPRRQKNNFCREIFFLFMIFIPFGSKNYFWQNFVWGSLQIFICWSSENCDEIFLIALEGLFLSLKRHKFSDNKVICQILICIWNFLTVVPPPFTLICGLRV